MNRCTFFLPSKDFFDVWHFRKGQFIPFDLLDNVINFNDDVLTSANIVVVGFVKVVGGCIQKLDKGFRGYFGNDMIGLFCGDVEFVVLHEG